MDSKFAGFWKRELRRLAQRITAAQREIELCEESFADICYALGISVVEGERIAQETKDENCKLEELPKV